MRNLTILDMSQNQIMDDGFKFLTTASYLSNLHKLFVNDCGLTEKAA
jgi:Ran GTPase-activating protein (RanGAP) involved in mRNA processing and transport